MRSYVHLPDDAELVALWRANGEDIKATAAVIGCSGSAVNLRLNRIGAKRLIVRPRAVRGTIKNRTAALEAMVETLALRVAELEARPSGTVRIVEWRPDHKRHADGGRPVREQRREVGLPRRLEAVS